MSDFPAAKLPRCQPDVPAAPNDCNASAAGAECFASRKLQLNMSRRLLPLAVLACAAIPAAGGFADPAPFMMRATVDGRTIEGQPLVWDATEILLLGRDGALYDFNPADAKDAKRTAGKFVPYASGEMQAALRAEFDRRFDVSTTAHFVVVHPRGGWSAWAERLESLYRSFTHYLAVRGFHAPAPATPLVAVVFRTQDEYFRHAAAGGTPLAAGTLGHYDPTTNRVYLYDVEESDGDAGLAANAETIIHEAVHQTAYNTGVHRRFAEQPRWLVEGLAMMFEARGVWDGASHLTQADRINRDRLDYFRRTAEARTGDWLAPLVASDDRFQSDPLGAYAEAWVLTFYLCETRPQEYSAYLARVAAREMFSTYSPRERIADFIAVFGNDLTLLASQINRFVETLPQ